MQGTIKTLNEKGFGFIAVEGGAEDIFFHHTALIDVRMEDLKPGDAVTFETEQSEKGARGKDVRRV